MNPNEKRVRNLIARSGLQLSTPLKISNSVISIPDSEEKSNTFAKKSSDRDTAYMDAVNRGDMETAQRMVDEAAKMTGFDSPKCITEQRHLASRKLKQAV